MAYADTGTVRDILDPDGARGPGTAACLSDDKLQEAIDEATSEVDGRLAVRYSTPFADPAPALVANITRDVAAYLATLTHRKGNPMAQDDPVRLRYARASTLLAQLVSGGVSLDVGLNPPADEAQVVVVNPYEGDLFTMDDFGLGQEVGRRRC